MTRLDEATRRRLAASWDPRVCTAREFARLNGVSERALRLWRQRLRHEQPHLMPGRHDSMPLLAAAKALHARLDELGAAVEGLHGALAELRAVLDAAEPAPVPGGTDAAEQHVQDDAQAERAAATPLPVEAAAVPAAPTPRVRPAKRGSYFRDLQ